MLLFQDVFVSSDGEDSFDAKSDNVSGNGASGSGIDDVEHGKGDDAGSDDSRTVVEESDSSEDEVCFDFSFWTKKRKESNNSSIGESSTILSISMYTFLFPFLFIITCPNSAIKSHQFIS